jgi:ketosteroid isomerase-like protein
LNQTKLSIDLAKMTQRDDEGQIQQLTVSFADAVNRRNLEQFTSLWSDRGVWSIEPPLTMQVTGVEDIAAAFTRLLAGWEFFVQIVHQGSIELNGDRATARWYMSEVGRDLTGEGFQNYGVYLDELIRQDDLWLFVRRTYRFIYIDRPKLTGQAFLPK